MTLHQPVPAPERNPGVDALRGLALLGIILANVPVSEAMETENYFLLNSRSFNALLGTLIHILVSTKFITLFSILFGYGFYVQLNRAAGRGVRFQRYFLVRMLLLLGIGCLHGYLLWSGDIIRYYAVCGVFLLLFRQVATRRLLLWSLIFIIPLTALVFILNSALGLQQYAYDYSIPRRIYGAATYSQFLRWNATIDSGVNFIQDSPIIFVSCFGKILLGYWLGRISFFEQPQRFAAFLRRWIGWAGLAGLLASFGYWAVTSGKLELDLPLLWLPFLIAGGLVLHSLFYLALFTRLFSREGGRKWLAIFVPTGRMALTNYLLQTFFYLLFFYRWPGGLYLGGKISLAETYGLAGLFYSFQVVLSRWWLQRFEQGPVEYLWKKRAYGAARRVEPGVVPVPGTSGG